MKKTKIINKLVGRDGLLSEERKVNYKHKWKHYIKPSIKLYSYKTFIILTFSLFYLLILRLLNYKITWLNYASSIALYFLIEDFFTKIKIIGNKK